MNFNFNEDKKRLFNNFLCLSSVQATNYLLPLITVPYLVRVLGVGKYGLLAFAQAFIQYFVIFTDYGFNSSATREISVNRSDNEKISLIFSSVMVIKILFTILSLIFLSLIVFSFKKFREEYLLYFLTFGIVVGNVLFPVWFFQGMERMKYITYRNVISKVIFTIFIFIFVRKSSDYLYISLINSLGYLATGIFSLCSVFKDFDIKLRFPSVKDLKTQLKEGWNIFISGVAINVYTTTNTFVLGLFTNNIIVGYYAAGEKIVRMLIGLFTPFFQAVYPYISKVVVESKQRAIRILNRIFALSFSISIIIFLLVLIFSKNLVYLILGNKFPDSVIIVRMLSPLILIVPAAYIFANLALLPFKLDKYFARIYIVGGILNIGLLFVFLYILNLKGQGAALANLVTETMVTLTMYFVLTENKIKII